MLQVEPSIIKRPSSSEGSRLAETHMFQKQESQASCGMSTPQWEQKASTSTSQMASVGRQGTGWTSSPFLTCSWIGVLGWRLLLWEMHLSFACKTSLSDWWTCPRAERHGTGIWNIAALKENISLFRKPQLPGRITGSKGIRLQWLW